MLERREQSSRIASIVVIVDTSRFGSTAAASPRIRSAGEEQLRKTNACDEPYLPRELAGRCANDMRGSKRSLSSGSASLVRLVHQQRAYDGVHELMIEPTWPMRCAS